VRQPDLDQLMDLMGLIYDGALSADGWNPLLERATRVFGASGAILFVHDLSGNVEFSTHWGLPDDAMDAYTRDFAPIDVARDTVLALPPGTVVTEESTPADLYRRSVILNEFRKPWDLARYVGYDVYRDPRRVAGFALQASARRPPFGAEEAALLERMLPHLRRAIAMSAHLGQSEAQRRGLADAIDGLVVGVVLVGDGSEVLFANAAARRIVQRRDGLALSGGRLRAHVSDDDRALAKAIANAIETSGRASVEGGGVVSVQRAWGAPSYSVLVNPGPGADSRSPLRTASAIILIGDPDAEVVSAEQIVTRLYDLTPGEARLALAVASGDSIETYAAERDIAVATVRWTMQQVLAKTGVRREADLVRLLLTGPTAMVKRPPAIE